MSHSELEEQAIAYLLGELDESETADFEARIASDPSLSRLVDELESTLGDLALAGAELEEPNPELGKRIMDSLPEKKEAVVDNASSNPSQSRKAVPFPITAALGWAAAACFLFLFIQQRTENRKLDQQIDIASIRLNGEIDSLSNQIATLDLEKSQLEELVSSLRSQRTLDKIQIAALSSEVEQLYHGFAIWDDAKDEGVVRVYNLPEIDQTTQNYQMWVISERGPNPISGGVFEIDALGNAEYRFAPGQPIDRIAAFAISLEKKGGAPVPSQVVMSGNL